MKRHISRFGMSVALVAVCVLVTAGTSFGITNLLCDTTGCSVDFADSCTAYSGPVTYSQLPVCGFDGYVMKWAGGSWGCAQETTGTTYTQGTGILINAGTISADIGTGTTQVAAGNHAHNYDAAYVNVTGDTITGNLTVDGNVNTGTEYRISDEPVLRTPLLGNLFVGKRSGFSITSSSANTLIGEEAGYSITSSGGNTFLGYRSGRLNTAFANTFVGNYAGSSNTTGGSVFIGDYAGSSNTTGYNNVFVGGGAGLENTIGFLNTFVGDGAGSSNLDGYSNTFIGRNSGVLNVTGKDNVYLGLAAGRANTGGSYNTIIGSGAGYNATGSYNVFLGYNAGYNETGSDRLYIDNLNTSTPLIYGEFDNNLVRINGNFDVTGTISGNGSGLSNVPVGTHTHPTSQITGLGALSALSAVSGGPGGTITDASITSADIGNSAVTSAHILDGTIITADIADGTILNVDISAAAAISDSKLATISTAGKVADTALSSKVVLTDSTQTITGAKTLSSVAITGGSINNTSIGTTTASTGAFTTLTATGYVTFDTNTFRVDSVNNRVGVGTTTPADKLDVVGNVQVSGDYKFTSPKTYYLQLPAAAFQQVVSATSGQWVVNSAYGRVLANGGYYIVGAVAPINLPEGATISEYKCYYYDNDTIDDIAFSSLLYHRNVQLTGTTTVASVAATSTGASAIIIEVSDTPAAPPVIANANNQYVAALNWSPGSDSSSLRFYGCRIAYTMTTLNP